MYLINTSTLAREKFTQGIPSYAILSHHWGLPQDEVSFKEFRRNSKVDNPGGKKIRKFCEVARRNRWEWAWVDTCCIDLRSSAELSESINSMFTWYKEAGVCHAFLEDIHQRSKWHTSQWWQRGWTLQELIAPKKVIFYDGRWRRFTSKRHLAKRISEKTGIPTSVLKDGREVHAMEYRSEDVLGGRAAHFTCRRYGILSAWTVSNQHAVVVWGGHKGFHPITARNSAEISRRIYICMADKPARPAPRFGEESSLLRQLQKFNPS